jgi:hypothetical protein
VATQITEYVRERLVQATLSNWHNNAQLNSLVPTDSYGQMIKYSPWQSNTKVEGLAM